MLPRANRLKGNESYAHIKRRGLFYKNPDIKMGVVNRKDNDPSKFGIIVSKRISKRAVLRNRIKRMLREIIRGNLKKIKSGSDILVIANSDLSGLGSRYLERQFMSLAKKANILK